MSGPPVPNCSTCDYDEQCDDDNECTTDSCHPTIHICVNLPVTDTTVCDDEDPCTDSDACLAGVCVGNTMADGTDCDDGNVCTSGTTCTSGACTGGSATDCTHLDEDCKTGTCNAVTGECEALSSNEGGLCTANCISEGACYDGECVAVTTVDCTHLDDDCNAGVCDPDTGLCTTEPANEGFGCDDGLLCTEFDACSGGVCAGTAIDCSAYADDCNAAACNDETGVCETTVINEGGPCEDGDLCTEDETCSAGVCSGTAVDCSHLDDDCVEGTCNPSDGTCETNPINQGLPCSDDDLCTENDLCQSGSCIGEAVDCTAFEDTCNSAACDPGTGSCVQTSINEGQTCNDGLRCTLYDACADGICTGVPRDCSVLDSYCSEGICNPTTGQCQMNPIREGETCDDGLPCTTDDTCVGGTCVGVGSGPSLVNLSWQPVSTSVLLDSVVQMALVAQTSTCEPQDIGSLYAVITWDPDRLTLTGDYTLGPYAWPFHGFPDDNYLDGLNEPYTGVPDNDGDAWFSAGAEFFAGAEVTDAGLVVATFDFIAHTTTDGVASAVQILPMLETSETLVLQAQTGLDITGAVADAAITIVECFDAGDCDDGNLCTDDVCDGAGRCQNPNNTLPCDDGLFCTSVDVCGGGTCNGSTDPCSAPDYCSETLDACVECLEAAHCNDDDVCTTDTCDATGSCVNEFNTAPCDDGLFCTAIDICDSGVCIGNGDTCAGTPSTPYCDEAVDSCVECLNAAHCFDGAYCNGVETCIDGVCGDGPDPCPQHCYEPTDECVECLVHADCDDDNVCTIDLCTLSHSCTALYNSESCDDGLFCTLNDYCHNGECQGGEDDPCPGLLCDDTEDRCVECFDETDCDDLVACTYSECDDGTCVFVPDDMFCDDGDYCNGAEYCSPTTNCETPGNPCDYPLLCNDESDTCGCAPPIVEALGPRYLAVTPVASALLAEDQWGMAIEVSAAGISCLPMYVDADGLLQTTPVYQTQAEWGTVHVHGRQIVPSTEYEVRIVLRRPVDAYEVTSESTFATTSIWADLCGVLQSDPPNGVVNLTDILFVLDAFATNQGLVAVNGQYAADLTGPDGSCVPNGVVNLSDVLPVLDNVAHPSPPYPAECEAPCP